MFFEKYGSLDLYHEDMKKIFIIEHEQLKFDKNYGWTLIGICNKPGGFMSYHEIFFIHDDIFGIIQSAH